MRMSVPLSLTALLGLALGVSASAQAGMMQGSVDVNGAKIFYKSQGSGPTLLLIHGYPLSGELFKNNRDALAKAGYRVVTIDLPGFGKSVAPDANYSIQRYAREVLGFMDAMKMDKATIGGMSMGGMTVLEMYREQPQRFNAMLLIDTTADPAGIAEKGEWLGTADQAGQLGSASLVPVLLPRMLTGVDRMKMPNQVMHLGNLVKQASYNGAVGGGKALAARPDANPVLSTIKVPTLILVGVEDNVTPIELAMKMNQGIAGSKLVMLPGAGHAAIFEKADMANQAILDWMKGMK